MPDGSVPLALIVLRENIAAQILALQQTLKLFDQAHPEVLAEVKHAPVGRAVVVNPFAPPSVPQAPRIPLLEEENPPDQPTNRVTTNISENMTAAVAVEAMNGHTVAPGAGARICKDGSSDRRYRAEIDAVRRGDKDKELTRLWNLNWSCERIAKELDSNITNVSRRAKVLDLPKRSRADVVAACVADKPGGDLPQLATRGRLLMPASIARNITAAKRFPEDAPAYLSRLQAESQTEASLDVHFPQALQRRCPVCAETFKTKIVDETICADCLGTARRRVTERPEQRN